MITNSHKTEYWFHVSNQEDIPIFGTVDKAIDIPYLLAIIQNLPTITADQSPYIFDLIKANSESIDILRTFVGVSDKRMYLELSYIFGKTKFNEADNENVLGYSVYDLEKHNVSFFKSLTKLKAETEVNKARNKKAKKAIEIIANYLISKGIISKAVRVVTGPFGMMERMPPWLSMHASTCIFSLEYSNLSAFSKVALASILPIVVFHLPLLLSNVSGE